MEDKNSKASTLLAISILVLAASLVYFTFELSRFIRQVPDILENIRTTSEKVEPVLEEVSLIRDLIPPILDEVSATRKQIPAILDEVKHVREAIPSILTEVDKTREQLPLVLNEVAAVREQVPAILASTDKASAAVVSASQEMKAYQPIVSDAMAQLDEVRKEVPATLDRVDGMIDRAQEAASEASSGLVTGVIGGLITAPFKIVGNFASSILRMSEDEAHNYTEEDLLLVKEHGQNLLANGKLNDFHKWENTDTGKSFKVSLNKIYSKDSQACRDLLLQAWSESKLIVNKVVSVCLNDEGEWEHH